MTTLARERRKELEGTVRQARRVAEAGALKALEQLAIHHHEPWPNMTPERRALRNRLRAHGRQLGDKRDERRGNQSINHLLAECGYEHWHRMLFARFLAENELLIEPSSGVAISLSDCQELARARNEDWLALASAFAVKMLPQIFRQGDPVLEVALPPETRSELEDLLKKLPREVFVADDSLGWVYQFWQADRKDEINKSEKKIGADELPAVTQLFTEDYMVLFLLHNTLGAWWAGKVLAQKPELTKAAKSEDELRAACAIDGIQWTYLRFVRDGDEPWRPVAGTFDGWPRAAKEVTILDPCMGSGHFLVFALPIMVALRIEEERLSREVAVEAVLRDNLFGLEIDQRCTQIAAFNLAFAAWRMVGYRSLPRLNLACSGLPPGVSKADWLKLAERAAASAPVPPKRDLFGSKDNLFSRRIKDGIERLYDLFAKAPWLGSLIDPRAGEAPLAEATFVELEPLLTPMLARWDDDLIEVAVTAQGMAKAAELLARQFVLLATNVPYLGRGKQDETIKEYCDRIYRDAKAELGVCFLERCLSLSQNKCTLGIVIRQNWLQDSYPKLRERLLTRASWQQISRLGPRAFETISGEVVNVVLLTISNTAPDRDQHFSAIDVSARMSPQEKDIALRLDPIRKLSQRDQLKNPDHRIVFQRSSELPLLGNIARSLQGLKTGDDRAMKRFFWELPKKLDTWRWYQGTVDRTAGFGGCDSILRFEGDGSSIARLQGQGAWGRKGIAVNLMSGLSCGMYFGEIFDSNIAALIPENEALIPPLWAYCSSEQFASDIRTIDSDVKVETGALTKIPFDLRHWENIARVKYPSGLPKPYSSDPTQWVFDGCPATSQVPLQVAVARMLGYRWPRQTGSDFRDCPAIKTDGLEKHSDPDGIICLSSIKGQPGADERLRALLADAYGPDWSASKLAALLTDAGFENDTLDDWLRDGFFAQHCEIFKQRPFLWHVWDGRRDGFNALVIYHRLAASKGEGRQTLEKLIYTYLGAWIDLQRADQKKGVDGADARVAAAEHLKVELEKILAGEPPYDIFVRWKPLAEQPIGWEPDINDGIRVNTRPFITARPFQAHAANACILRTTPKIKWDKDRGKEAHRAKEEYPWFWTWDEETQDFAGGKVFDGNRWNDLHYTNAFKRAAREQNAAPAAKARP